MYVLRYAFSQYVFLNGPTWRIRNSYSLCLVLIFIWIYIVYRYACVEWHLSISLRQAACPTRQLLFLWLVVVFVFPFFKFIFDLCIAIGFVCLTRALLLSLSLCSWGTHSHIKVCLLLFMKCSHSTTWPATVFWCQRHAEVYWEGFPWMCKHGCK